MASLFIDVHLLKAQLSLFRDGNCFIIASPISDNSLCQSLLEVEADSTTESLCNPLHDCRSLRFDTAFDEIWVETNPNMR